MRRRSSNDLVTTDDGEQLYFSSSLRMRGTISFSTRRFFESRRQTRACPPSEIPVVLVCGQRRPLQLLSLRSPSLSGVPFAGLAPGIRYLSGEGPDARSYESQAAPGILRFSGRFFGLYLRATNQ